MNEQGQPVIFNETTRSVLIASLTSPNQNDMPLLGRAFLTSAYLVSENDQRQFTLYGSNPTTSQDLVTIQPPGCINQSNQSNQSLNSSTTSTGSEVPLGKGGLSTGAIVGVVVGVVVLFALVTLAILLICRRRAQGRGNEGKEMPTEIDNTESYHRHASHSDTGQGTGEMNSDQQPLQELPPVQHQPYTLSPYEMPISRHHHELSSERCSCENAVLDCLEE